MEIQKWLQETMSRQERRAVPIMTHPGIELCGKTVKDAVSSGEVHAEAICRLNEQYPAAAPTVIMDLTVEAEAFGAKVVFPEDEVPSVTEPLVSDKESIDNLQIPSLDAGRVPEYLKANRLTAERVKGKPVFAGCIGPFSLAGRLFGLSELMIALYVEPENIAVLLEKCTRFLIDYTRAIKQTGVHGVIMAEPAAGLISNEDCILYSTNYVRQIVDAVHNVLERTPPELAADIFDRGIVMTGGGSLLSGLDALIEEKTGITTMIAEDPLTAVAIGTGKFIEFAHGMNMAMEASMGGSSREDY